MNFTVQVIFTGLGIAVIHKLKKWPHSVKGVDLLLVDMQGDVNLTDSHFPRLTFEIDDLLDTHETYFDGCHCSTRGIHEIDVDISKQDFALKVAGQRGSCKVKRARSGACRPGRAASEDAIDWIPDIETHLGIDDLILPGQTLAGSPYTSRVRLPAGNVSSRRLFLSPDGSFTEYTYGSNPVSRVLVESLVWTRRVTGVELGVGRKTALDPQLRVQRGDAALVRIAVTNLPQRVLPKRYGGPGHFRMFSMVSAAGKPANEVRPVGGEPVTPDGGCPPARKEILG